MASDLSADPGSAVISQARLLGALFRQQPLLPLESQILYLCLSLVSFKLFGDHPSPWSKVTWERLGDWGRALQRFLGSLAAADMAPSWACLRGYCGADGIDGTERYRA